MTLINKFTCTGFIKIDIDSFDIIMFAKLAEFMKKNDLKVPFLIEWKTTSRESNPCSNRESENIWNAAKSAGYEVYDYNWEILFPSCVDAVNIYKNTSAGAKSAKITSCKSKFGQLDLCDLVLVPIGVTSSNRECPTPLQKSDIHDLMIKMDK